jgi:hypothetical protein
MVTKVTKPFITPGKERNSNVLVVSIINIYITTKSV